MSAQAERAAQPEHERALVHYSGELAKVEAERGNVAWYAPRGVTMVAVAADELTRLQSLFQHVDGDWTYDFYGGAFDGGQQIEPYECVAKLPNGEMFTWDQQRAGSDRCKEIEAMVAAVNFARNVASAMRDEVKS